MPLYCSTIRKLCKNIKHVKFLHYQQIEDGKIREIIKNEMILYKKIDSHAKTILKMSPMLFQVREAEAAIYRNVPELKPALIKLNNHKLNRGLMLLTLCSWLCVFACAYGYVRALKIGK